MLKNEERDMYHSGEGKVLCHRKAAIPRRDLIMGLGTVKYVKTSKL